MAKPEHAGTEERQKNPFAWTMEVEPLRALVSAGMPGWVQQPAKAFLGNIERVEALAMLPLLIAAEGVRKVYWTLSYVSVYLGSAPRPPVLQSEHIESEPSRSLASLATQHLRDRLTGEDRMEEFADQIHKALLDVFDLDGVKRGFSVLLRSHTVLLWGAFECLARDLWVALMNQGDVRISSQAFKVLDDESSGITSKHIQVGLLARHGFDIRGKVGTLLESKFNFTGVDGIRAAYEAPFGKEHRICRILDCRDLFLLEKYRHLLVHKAGQVDEKFRKETGCLQELGTEIIVEPEFLARLAESAIKTGVELISRVAAALDGEGAREGMNGDAH